MIITIMALICIIDLIGYIITSRKNKAFIMYKWRYIPFIWILYPHVFGVSEKEYQLLVTELILDTNEALKSTCKNLEEAKLSLISIGKIENSPIRKEYTEMLVDKIGLWQDIINNTLLQNRVQNTTTVT